MRLLDQGVDLAVALLPSLHLRIGAQFHLLQSCLSLSVVEILCHDLGRHVRRTIHQTPLEILVLLQNGAVLPSWIL